MNEDIKMSVSPICVKDGKKYAFVSFTDGNRVAEGKIPECRITHNTGFDKEETAQLEAYMKRELAQLKHMAAGINVMDNFLR
ncbi:MAG: hypothetical protein NC321_09520 [Clostridium sp.]|nr:hypothetical protein [Clostridium sp.]